MAHSVEFEPATLSGNSAPPEQSRAGLFVETEKQRGPKRRPEAARCGYFAHRSPKAWSITKIFLTFMLGFLIVLLLALPSYAPHQ